MRRALAERLEGAVGKGDFPADIEAADRLHLILDHVAVFALRGLNQRGQLLDTAGQAGQLVISGEFEFYRQAFLVLLAFHLVGQVLDAPQNGPVDNEEHEQKHEARGQNEPDEKIARRLGSRFIKRPAARNHDVPRAGWLGKGCLDHAPRQLAHQNAPGLPAGKLVRGSVAKGHFPAKQCGCLGKLRLAGGAVFALRLVGEKVAHSGSRRACFLVVGDVELPEHGDPDDNRGNGTEREKSQRSEDNGARVNRLGSQPEGVSQPREGAPRERIFRRNKADHAASARAQQVPRPPEAPRPLF